MRRAFSCTALLLLIFTLDAGTAQGADPFYLGLLQEGELAAARGDDEMAIRHFTLASFGLLEEPQHLAESLVRLALVEARVDDEAAFAKTWGRLLEIEQRFQAYSQAPLSAALRHDFEDVVVERIPYESLQRVGAFAPLARRKEAAAIREMPAGERRTTLDARLAAEPDDVAWRLLSADLYLSKDEPVAALEDLAHVLLRNPRHVEAQCARGRARAALGRCDEAMGDLDACGDEASQPDIAEARLGCLIAAEQWTAANALLARLPEATRKQSPFRQQARQVRRGLRSSPQEVALPAPTSADTPPPTPPEIAVPPPSDALVALPITARQQVEAIQKSLDGPLDGAALKAAFDRARTIADENPRIAALQHLVAEIAYRLARWPDAVTYFQRGGTIELNRPDRIFYYAIALYETGNPEHAALALERCLERLEKNRFVQTYVEKILGGAG